MAPTDYSRVPAAETSIEMREDGKGIEGTAASHKHEEAPASRAMVIFSVSFYLVAALVVRLVHVYDGD